MTAGCDYALFVASSEVQKPFEGVGSDAVAGAAVGFAFGGPVGAVAGALVPVAERLTRLSLREIRVAHQEARQDRAKAAWLVAGKNAGDEIEQLVEAAAADADRRHLAYSVTEGAAESRYPARIVALGRALASGLLASDVASLDHEQQVVDTLAQIERPHIVLLHDLVNVEGTAREPVFVRRTLSWSQIAQFGASYGSSLPRILASLEREGLVHTSVVAVPGSDDGPPLNAHDRAGTYWQISDFGYEVLERLWQAGVEGVLDGHSGSPNEV
jgi:hypothetical protein